MKRLHILRKTKNPEAERFIFHQVREGEQVEVILIQDAVFLRKEFDGAAEMACAEDAEARNTFHHTVTLEYAEILEKIMATPSVVCW